MKTRARLDLVKGETSKGTETWKHTKTSQPLEIADFAPYANGQASKTKFRNAGECVADEHDLLLVPCVPIHRPGCVVEVERK